MLFNFLYSHAAKYTKNTKHNYIDSIQKDCSINYKTSFHFDNKQDSLRRITGYTVFIEGNAVLRR